MGGLSRRGDPYVRTLLASGARSVLASPHPPQWATQMLMRRPFNVVVIALANKLARTAWALVAHQRSYNAQWHSTPPEQLASPA
jgi:transposase